MARNLYKADAMVRQLIADSKAKANEIADSYRQAFKAEGEAQSEAAKEEVQRRYGEHIRNLQDAKRWADSQRESWNRWKKDLEAHLKWAGVCKYQDIDPASGKKMRMLAQVPEPQRPGLLAIEQSPTTQLEARKMHCSYLGPGGADYRGTMDSTGDGKQCLPWPKSYALKYHGSGLAKDIAACAAYAVGSRCYESCLAEQETNTYCRNPTDAKQPFCRTGGTEEDPVFSACTSVFQCADTGCTHNEPDGSDYDGEISFTVSGRTCDEWKTNDKWISKAAEEGWHNFCRNPDGKKLPWCLVKDAPAGWEFCDVGKSCSDSEETTSRVDEVKEAGPVLPFPVDGLYAHYTTRGFERTSPGVWDDESGNNRHSIQSSGLVLQGLATGHGAARRVGYLSGTMTTSILFPPGTIPGSFTVCSVSKYATANGKGQIVSAEDKNWFNGHGENGAGK